MKLQKVEATLGNRTATAEITEWVDADGWQCTGPYVQEYWEKAKRPLCLGWTCSIPRGDGRVLQLEMEDLEAFQVERILSALLLAT